MSRSRHHGCSCSMCKPWKHDLEPKNKPSERRKLQEADIDDEAAYDDFLCDLRITEALNCCYYDQCSTCEKGESPE